MKNIRLIEDRRKEALHVATPLETALTMLTGFALVVVPWLAAILAHHFVSHKEYDMLLLLIVGLVTLVFVAFAMRSSQISRDEGEE